MCFMRLRLVSALSLVVASAGLLQGCGSNTTSTPLGTPGVAPATSVLPKITSLNGEYDPNHAQEVYVHPGDMVTLTADIVDPKAGFRAQGDSVEDFVWSA